LLITNAHCAYVSFERRLPEADRTSLLNAHDLQDVMACDLLNAKESDCMKRVFQFIALALAVTAVAGRSADAGVTYSFTGVTSNNTLNTAIGESQLSLTVSDAGGGFVNFEFTNNGPEKSSITDVYFDDNVDPSLFIDSIAAIDDSERGVSFSEGANPGNLPGGATIGFEATRGLTADSNRPKVTKNGVNPGESLGILLELTNGHSFSDVTTALDDSTLRVGIHVQAFENGGSESFVTGGGGAPPAVPEPTSLAIFGIGLAGFAARRRKQKSQ